jgi:hypothetical protein
MRKNNHNIAFEGEFGKSRPFLAKMWKKSKNS